MLSNNWRLGALSLLCFFTEQSPDGVLASQSKLPGLVEGRQAPALAFILILEFIPDALLRVGRAFVLTLLIKLIIIICIGCSKPDLI